MASKNVAEVVIAGRVLKITGYESTEYLHQVAAYINDKIGEFEQLDGYRRYSSDQKQILLYMNLADDFFKAKRQADGQKAELEKKEKEMYSLKHDLIESQMARESLEKASEEENRQQEQIFKEKLESAKKDYKEKNRQLELKLGETQEQLTTAQGQFQAAQEQQETQGEAFREELETKLKSAQEEAQGLRAQIRELRHEIVRLEAEAKGRNNRSYGNRGNGN